jgi:hypothetical protein
MIHSPPDDFEARIQRLASAFPYPATPDLSTQAGMDRFSYRGAQKMSPQRLARYALAILILLAAVSMLVPSVRAAVLEFLQIGGLRINLQTPSPDPGTQLQPAELSPTANTTIQPSLFSEINLAGETSLDLALEAWGDPILLPEAASELGLPDRIFLQARGAPYLICLWLDPLDEERLQASLLVLKPGAFLSKDPPGSYQEVQVRDQSGLWFQGEHFLHLDSPVDTVDLRVLGNVLVWEEDGFTYRLESFYDLEQSQAIAESLRPYP